MMAEIILYRAYILLYKELQSTGQSYFDGVVLLAICSLQ